MSVDHLPDDVRRWPRDPYQVLGLAKRCAADDARRAYTRLIRHFKPEQCPEQFRLIREAYDAVKRQASYFGGVNPRSAEMKAETGSTDAAGASGGFHVTRKAESLQIAWDLACNGREAEAYDELRTLYNINPNDRELPARLYAMLLADPELDHVRTRCDWLVRGVRSEGPWGPCRQLYRREIDDHPEEALTERFIGMLESLIQTKALIELLGWRWGALSRLDMTELIAADLARVAPRLEHADEESWVRLLLKAADYLAWRQYSRFDELCEAIESHIHMHVVLGEDLSRLDLLRELSHCWQALHAGNIANVPLLNVVPLAWTGPLENRHRILAHCRAVAEKPELALGQLDQLRLGQLFAAHLVQSLAGLWDAPHDPRDQSAMLAVVKGHFDDVAYPASDAAYALYRHHLLRLCVAEVIAPEAVASMLDPDRAAFVIQKIRDDWELRAVCLAHRVIWA